MRPLFPPSKLKQTDRYFKRLRCDKGHFSNLLERTNVSTSAGGNAIDQHRPRASSQPCDHDLASSTLSVSTASIFRKPWSSAGAWEGKQCNNLIVASTGVRSKSRA